ncbi:transcription repressor OFP12-like [Miscanthus floridulus]|uniref:transcription repressor OFP12-like n=1 Tax=Miscanthus floridulus TaxID=154761 RepID=UPI003457EAC7
MEEDDKSTKAAGCKKNVTRLHRSFLHLSRALGKLHGRRGHHANANGETSLSSSSSTATSFLSGCMHPRTHSFSSPLRHRHKHDDDGSGDALAVNFRSLRVGLAASAAAVPGDEGGSSSAQDYCYGDGGSEADADEPKAVVRGAGVAVATLSAAPYEDFRRSMREMVDASAGSGAAQAAVDWDFMEELLFCYLRLNDRAVHKDILRAFTDTVAAIRRRRRRAAKSRLTRRRRRRQQPGAGGDGRGDCDCDGAEAVTSISS